MNNEKYIEDLKDIKTMMSKSSRFISLSGLSGVFAGLFSLIGAYFAYDTIYAGQDYLGHRIAILNKFEIFRLLLIAALTIGCSIVTGIYFTTKKTREQNQSIWNREALNFIISLSIPLITGGIFCFILLLKGYIGLIAPVTLLFYGLALVNGSHHTMRGTRSLGIFQICLGLLGTYYIGYGLILWSVGFGLSHILYGIYMHITDK